MYTRASIAECLVKANKWRYPKFPSTEEWENPSVSRLWNSIWALERTRQIHRYGRGKRTTIYCGVQAWEHVPYGLPLDHPDVLYSTYHSTYCSATSFFPPGRIYVYKKKVYIGRLLQSLQGGTGRVDFTLRILFYEFFKQKHVFQVFQFVSKK